MKNLQETLSKLEKLFGKTEWLSADKVDKVISYETAKELFHLGYIISNHAEYDHAMPSYKLELKNPKPNNSKFNQQDMSFISRMNDTLGTNFFQTKRKKR